MSILNSGIVPVGSTGYDIDNSLRFNDNDSAYLSRTPASAGNRKTWVFSTWIKRGNLGSGGVIFGAVGDNARIRWSSDRINWEFNNTFNWRLTTTAVYRDPSAWYHIVIAVDTTQSTASNRMMMYVNGTKVTSFDHEDYPSLNGTGGTNNNSLHSIGRDATNSDNYFDGYRAETYFIDGQSFFSDTSGTANSSFNINSFGETGTYGEWKPIAYAGSYGTNGFYLDFSNSGDKQTLTVNSTVTHSTTSSKIGSSSIKFNNSGYLYPSNLSAFDFSGGGDLTVEFWFNKIGTATNNHHHIYSWAGSSNGYMAYRDAGSGDFQWNTGGQSLFDTTSVSTGTWYHIAFVRDGNTYRIYRDGVQVTSASVINTMPAPTDLRFGRGANGWTSQYANMYIDEFRVSNSCRYPSGTTFTPSTTAFTDDSNTLLLIHSDTTNGSTTFTDDSGAVGGLGNDASSNTNNWTVNNLAATDQMLDSPTNNFCTLNPLSSNTNATLSEGSLRADSVGSGTPYRNMAATFSVSSGKWYYEWAGYSLFSIYTGFATSSFTSNAGISEGVYYDNYYGKKRIFGTGSAYGATWTSGDVIGIAIDVDSNSVTFYKNGVSQGSFSYTDTEYITPMFVIGDDSDINVNFGQDSSFAGNKTAQGNQDSNSIGDFYYEPPTDFLALCTSNLPDPAVVPSEHFNTVTYAGNSTVTSHTGLGFQPDLCWFKRRSGADSHLWYDAVRGNNKVIKCNNTGAEGTDGTDTFKSFDSDGFTLGTRNELNHSSHTFVAWNWKAGNATLGTGDFTQGSIASTCSRNVDAGFSIVSYTGTGSGSSPTVGHGLSSKPEFVVVKSRSVAGVWAAQHTYDTTKYFQMQDVDAAATGINVFDNVAPTSSVFTVNATNGVVNGSGTTYIAYCFHSVDGYSKVGSYTGNTSDDGPFIYTGFRPAYVMIKRSDGIEDWLVHDSARSDGGNPEYELIYPNSSIAEGDNSGTSGTSSRQVDFVSNGVKIRGANSVLNYGNTYIYLAFAEVPFSVGGNAR